MKINALNRFLTLLIVSTLAFFEFSSAQDQAAANPAAKPELSVQPIAPAPQEPAQVAPVVNEPAQVSPPAQNPLESVAQGLNATPTPLPVKATAPKENKTTGASSSSGNVSAHTPKKPSTLSPMGPSIKNVQGEKLAQATGHFARARSLLIAALAEFDKGTELANPDALFSSAEWRTSVTARAREIEHILAPQPRETTGGIKFQADPRLLGEAKR